MGKVEIPQEKHDLSVGPAVTQSIGSMREAAADVATKAGWPRERVDDVRLVVSEVCGALMANGESDAGVRVSCQLEGPLLFIEGTIVGEGGGEHLHPLGSAVLDELAEEYQVGATTRAGSIRVTLFPERPSRT